MVLNESPCSNICLLKYETIEFIELNYVCEHTEKYLQESLVFSEIVDWKPAFLLNIKSVTFIFQNLFVETDTL